MLSDLVQSVLWRFLHCPTTTPRSKNDELVDEVKFLQATGAGGAGGARPGAGGLELETIPPSVKERLLRLEHENKRLRAADGTSHNADLLQTMIDDLKERETQLQASFNVCPNPECPSLGCDFLP